MEELSRLESLYISLSRTLRELLELDNEIRGVILVNKAGQLIDYSISSDFEKQVKDNEFHLEGLAATIAAMFGATIAAGLDFKFGDVATVLAEFSFGRVVLVPCGYDAILALVTTNSAALGSIRILARKYAEKISQIIPSLIESIEEEIRNFAKKESLQRS